MCVWIPELNKKHYNYLPHVSKVPEELDYGTSSEVMPMFLPGGEDASNTNGIAFTYELRQPRKYRFFDVNKMFVRFVSGRGLLGVNPPRGFTMSVKHICKYTQNSRIFVQHIANFERKWPDT